MIKYVTSLVTAVLIGIGFQNCAQPLPTETLESNLNTQLTVQFFAVSAEGRQDTDFVEGTTITLIASHKELADAELNYVFSIERDGLSQELASSTQSSFEYGPVSVDDDGATLSVAVTVNGGASYSESFELSIDPVQALALDFYISDSAGTQVTSVPVNTSIVLHVEHVDPGFTVSYSWYKNDELLASTTVNSFSYGPVSLADNNAIFGVLVNVDSSLDYRAEKSIAVTEDPKSFFWVFGNTCPAGTVDTKLRDDTDAIHNLTESSGSGSTALCATGITDVQWSSICPDGYVDAGIRDDNDFQHNLNENSGFTCLTSNQKWCMQGISQALWVSANNCPAGWVALPIYDDGDSRHCLNEDGVGGAQQLCIR